jgi:hypothetical protein
VIFLIIFLVAIVIVITLGVYYIPKILGYPKTAKYMTIIFVLCLVYWIAMFALEDKLFTKADAKALVEEQQISLNDQFDLLKNESDIGFGDYYHTFILKISNVDKANAIRQITNAPNFTKYGVQGLNFLSDEFDQYKGKKRIQNYETEDEYVREYHKPNGYDYAPTYRRILISKRGNQLVFEDIDI